MSPTSAFAMTAVRLKSAARSWRTNRRSCAHFALKPTVAGIRARLPAPASHAPAVTARHAKPRARPIPPDVLIRSMSEANPLWGAPRINGELLKLGIAVSQATVATYMVRHRRPPSQTWRTFLTNHVSQIMAADFFVVPTATYRPLFVLVILAHQRRRVIHVGVTDHPIAAWTVQQLREAFPWDRAPRCLIRDRAHAFAGWAASARTMGIDEVLTAPRSPWQNAYAERFMDPCAASGSTTSWCSARPASRV
jgi:putative transposase